MTKQTSGVLALIAALAMGIAPAGALTINPTFDPSIAADLSSADAASWDSAINYVDAQLQNTFTDPITLNITFAASSGTSIFGQSNYFTESFGGYSSIKNALAADATSADDATAVANLPASDPTSSSAFSVTTAQGKALGLIAANDPARDGTVTIGAGFNYTYDPNNRAVSGKYDFIGIVEHEVTEVMGRTGIYNLGNPGALDLFGYQFGTGGTGTGTLNLTPVQANNYFSIDGGHTALKLYNDASNGEDDKDWGTGSNDAFNAFSNPGVENAMSAVDIREMDVIGYDLATLPTTFYWKGGQSNVWSALVGGTATNWTTDQTGTNDPHTTPNASINVIFSANSPANEGNTVLGADVSIKSLVVNDTNTVVISGSTNTLTISGTAGITLHSGAGPVTISSKVALGASEKWTNNSANLFTVSGQVRGAFSLTVAGSGTLVLSASNSYTGATSINGAVLEISNNNNLGAAGGHLNFNGGTLRTLAGVGSGRAITLNAAGGTFDTDGFNATLTGAISGSGGLVKTGLGTLTLGGTNTYNGGTAINGGVLGISSNSLNLGAAGVSLSFNGGTLRTLAAISSGRTLTLNSGGGKIDTDGFNSALTGVISGSGGFTKIGSGTLTLGGTNIYKGVTSINGGALAVSGNLNLGAAGVAVNFSGGTLRTLASMNSGRLIKLNANGGTLDTNGFNSTLGGVISGVGLLAKTGAGTLSLTGVNTYSGSTVISQGTLQLSGSGSIAHTPSITVTAGAVLNVSGLSSGSFVLGSGQTLIAGRTSGFANDVVGNLATGGAINIAGVDTAGIMGINGNLALNGGELLFDFSNVTTAGADLNDLISIHGKLSLSGTTIITPDLLNGTLATGTYTLISGTAGITGGNASDLAWGGPSTGQTIRFNTTAKPGTVYMIVAAGGGDSPSVAAITTRDDSNFVTIPEPSTWALLAAGAGLLVLRRRKSGQTTI